MQASQLGFNPLYAEDNPALKDISQLTGYAFLEFGAPWCEHCEAAQPAIEQTLKPLQLAHIKVYDGKGLVLGRAYKVRRWPTLILLKDGVELARVVRPTSTAQVNELLSSMSAG